jgi:hypothetical protein
MNYKPFTSKQKLCLPDFHGTISRINANVSALMSSMPGIGSKKKGTSADGFKPTGTEINMDKW